jgi:hydrogenase maturation protease
MDVELLEWSLHPLDLIFHIEGVEKVIIVDGVRSQNEPGTIYRRSLDGLRPNEGPYPMSLHEVD